MSSPLAVTATLGLSAEPASVRRARHFVRTFCGTAEIDSDVCETAALLTSELVTNALVHGGADVRLDVSQPEGMLVISVQDGSSAPLQPRDAHDDAEGGRGLQLVQVLAERWGTERLPGGGKVVWFSLRTT